MCLFDIFHLDSKHLTGIAILIIFYGVVGLFYDRKFLRTRLNLTFSFQEVLI